MAVNKPGFFEELKRRHVWRMAVAYVVAAWLIVQVATQVFPFFNIPNWVVRLVVVVLALGFAVAVVFAWVFELTPEGIRRTEPADSPQARETYASRALGRKLNALIIAVLVLAVIVLLGNQFVWHQGMRTAAVTTAPVPASTLAAPASAAPATAAAPVAASLPATAAIPEKSVAVLPFANEGAKGEQFFSDGLSEDLITALSQFAGLKVISRHSAFQFRDSRETSKAIGEKLGVAHILEGSVRLQGGEVRISATLVNAADGSIAWSHRYDQPYQDLFKLQDEVTAAVADALKAKLLVAPGAVVQSDRPPSGSLAAYAAYQRGKARVDLGTEAGFRQAITAYDEAIRLDPRYAVAYAALSQAWGNLAGYFLGDADQTLANARARTAADAALTLDPDSSVAHQARANLLMNADLDWVGAAAEAQRALQLAPHDPAAQSLLGDILFSLGQVRRAEELMRQALAADPRRANWYRWLSNYLLALGQLDQAAQAIQTAISLQPTAAVNQERLAIIEILRGDGNAALAAAQQEPPGSWRSVALAMVLQIGPDRAAADAALKDLIARHAASSSYQIAQVYGLRRDPDNTFKWLDRAWANRDAGIGLLLGDQLILRFKDDPRFAAFAKKVGLPTTTDAVAMK